MSEFNRVGGDAEAMKTAGQEMFLQIKRKSRNEAVVEGRFWAREVCFVLNGNYYMYVLVGKKTKLIIQEWKKGIIAGGESLLEQTREVRH